MRAGFRLLFVVSSKFMSHIHDADCLRDMAPAERLSAVFGYEEFWPEVYAEFSARFNAVGALIRLGDEMVNAAGGAGDGPARDVIRSLSRATITGACEAVLLCGNGFGAGAMKVVRGMYESRWTAEYLRRHPAEVEDYLEFRKILLWRRIHWLHENSPNEANRIPPEEMKRLKDDYEQAKARLKNELSWSKKSIRKIAVEIGCEKEYELPYAIACSIHHHNFEGLAAHFALEGGVAKPNPPPSRAWVKQALTAAFANLWFALNTLNGSYGQDYSEKLEAVHKDFVRVGTQ